MNLYLDANAHLPMNNKAMEAFVQFNKTNAGYGNAMASSGPGRAAASEIEKSREKIAKLIGAEANQIIFTSSCTQACEWGLSLLKDRNFSKVYCSTIEHPAVALKAKELFGNNDLFVSSDGVVACTFTPEQNSAYICIHIQNEIGVIQGIEKIPVSFFSDMSQSLGKIPINVNKINNLKLATFGAHKFGGPIGVGILYIQDSEWWKEYGSGSRYYFDRPGTPDAGSIVATAIALEEAIKTLPKRYENALRWNNVLESGIEDLGLKIIGKKAKRSPYTTFVHIGNKLGPYLMAQLESDGIYIGLGSACGSFSTNTSPVMTSLGSGGNAHDYIRISQWGDYGENEAKMVVKAIKKYLPTKG